MIQPSKEGDFRLKLLLKPIASVLILVRDLHHLHSHGPLLIDSPIDPTMCTGGKLIPDEELRKISHPVLRLCPCARLEPFRIRRIQQHRPRLQTVPPPLLHDLQLGGAGVPFTQ